MDHESLEVALARVQEPLVFIVGSGRSGTSLLAAMLDAHPDLAIASESHFLPKLIDGLPASLESPADVDRMIHMLGRSKWFAGWEYDTDALRTALEAALPVSRPDALRMIYKVHAASMGKIRYGEKTPAYVYSIPQLAAEIPDARFIHIVRDGRNVALSFREASFGTNDLEQTALTWQMRVLQGHKMGEALGAGRYIEVIYEDLIADPKAQLSRLCEFLDMTFSEEMTGYHERDSGWSPRGEASVNLAKPPTTTRDWRNQLTPTEHARIEILAKRALEAWGYQLTSKPTVADRAAAVRARGRWWFYRLRSKTGLARRERTRTGQKGENPPDDSA